jgi:hypothetical protein
LHVAEGIDDLGRWIDLLQLYLVDADTSSGTTPTRNVLASTNGGAVRARNRAKQRGASCAPAPSFLVGASSLHVAEGIDDLGRWIDLLQLHLVDADAGAIGIEDPRSIRQCGSIKSVPGSTSASAAASNGVLPVRLHHLPA